MSSMIKQSLPFRNRPTQSEFLPLAQMGRHSQHPALRIEAPFIWLGRDESRLRAGDG